MSTDVRQAMAWHARGSGSVRVHLPPPKSPAPLRPAQQASWLPTVSKGHLLAALGLVWLLIACVWLYTYSTRVSKEAKDETETEEPVLAFPLVLKGMHNVNRACESLLSLTYNSMQSLHKVKKGKTINVITSSDQKYMPGLIALINSTIVHTRNPLAFYIVADANPELHEQFQEFLYSLFPKGRFPKQTVVGFDTARVVKLIKTYPSVMNDPKIHANPNNYARFYFHEIFPELSKAVYLDPDTIMLGNIAELGTILDHQDAFLYAVAQGLPHTYGEAFYWKSPIVQQAFDKDEPYFNAGVAVINFDKWRSQNVTGVIEHWLALHKEQKLWSWGTQPPLMAAFYRNFHMLDSSWNVRHFGAKGMVPPLVEFVRAKVLHWNGANKPWSAECRRDSTCFRSCWAPFYDHTLIRELLAASPSLASHYSSLLRVVP